MNRSSITTPWGISDDGGHVLAPGITSYSTPSHGGIHLDAERLAQFTAMFPNFEPFCKQAGWFEEDCDWAFVALCFPEAFRPEDIRIALRIAAWDKGSNFKAYEDWSETLYGRQMLGLAPTTATLLASHDHEALDDIDNRQTVGKE